MQNYYSMQLYSYSITPKVANKGRHPLAHTCFVVSNNVCAMEIAAVFEIDDSLEKEENQASKQ